VPDGLTVGSAAGLDACLGHALAQAPFANEGLVEGAEEAVEEEVGLVNQADGHVSHGLGGACFGALPVKIKGLRIRAPELADIDRLG